MKFLKHAIFSLLMIVLGVGTWFACQDKIPPVGVIPGEDGTADSTLVATIRDSNAVWVPQEIDGGDGSGSGGTITDPPPDTPPMGTPLTGWKFVWKGPTGMSTSGDAWNDLTNFAGKTPTFMFDTPLGSGTDDHRFRPIVFDQDNQAEQLLLAKALVCVLSTTNHTKTYSSEGYNDAVSYYDECWQAIRQMMKQFTGSAVQPYNSGAWIGMARNLAAYAIAADYLCSLGPPDDGGFRSHPGQLLASSGHTKVHNYQTFDSLKTIFIPEVTSTNPSRNEYRAFNNSGARDKSLYDMLSVADNKGTAALASYAALVSFGMNMSGEGNHGGTGGNSLLYKYLGNSLCSLGHDIFCEWTDEYATKYTYVTGWTGAWQGVTTSSTYKFPRSKFKYGGGDAMMAGSGDYWTQTFVGKDSLYSNCTGTNCHDDDPVRPIKLGQYGTEYPAGTSSSCYEAGTDSLSDICQWSAEYVKGLPYGDMRRNAAGDGFALEPVIPRKECWSQKRPSSSTACMLRMNEHVQGTAMYLINLVNIIIQQDQTEGYSGCYPNRGGPSTRPTTTHCPLSASSGSTGPDNRPWTG